MRALALAVLIGCAVGLGTYLLDPQNVLRVLIFGVIASGVVLIVTLRPVSELLPSLAFNVRLSAPARPWSFRGKAKLRKEATNLARDIYAYLKSQPVAPLIDPEWTAMNDAIAAAGPVQANLNEAQLAIWHAHNEKIGAKVMREQQALAERFGGRITALLHEYTRRGLLTDIEARQIDWLARSHYRLHEAAQRIDALAKR